MSSEAPESPTLPLLDKARAPASEAEATPASPRAGRGLMLAQSLLGLWAYASFVLPFVRSTRGFDRLDPARRYLFVVNHVSLLDTILLGGLFWRRKCVPILVLGDRAVWHANWVKRFLSRRIGFLLERGKLNLGRLKELEAFARCGTQFHLIVYPEGTRREGVDVGPCQAGIYHVAQEARLPLVPVFIENMQLVSTKGGGFHPVRGWRKVVINFAEPIPAEQWLGMPREEFQQFVRQRIGSART